jgi:hypothetical protein
MSATRLQRELGSNQRARPGKSWEERQGSQASPRALCRPPQRAPGGDKPPAVRGLSRAGSPRPPGSSNPVMNKLPGGECYPAMNKLPGGECYPAMNKLPGGECYPVMNKLPGGECYLAFRLNAFNKRRGYSTITLIILKG